MGARVKDGKSIRFDDRPVIMGILNVTPDSFSDGGLYLDEEHAVDRARLMVAEGADIIDVGGESTRPGSQRVSTAEQIRRVAKAIGRVRESMPDSIPISVDTTSAAVAEAALEAGALMVNDVSAGRDDSTMLALVADRSVPIILMHMQGTPATMQEDPSYTDVVADVKAFLVGRAEAAQAEGVARGRIIIDPGIGFGKSKLHNLVLLAHLDTFVDTGYMTALGTSRKRFMGRAETDPEDLAGATCATTAIGVAAGVRIFRVHDVRANRQAADVTWAISRSRTGRE